MHMKARINKTIASAVIMLIIAVAVWLAIPFNISDAPTGDIGPRAFPRLMCIAIAALSLLQIILVLVKQKKPQHVMVDLQVYGRVFVAMLLALLTIIAAKYINLLVAAMLCSMAFLLILKVKAWKYYLAILATGGVLFVLMKYVMHIRF